MASSLFTQTAEPEPQINGSRSDEAMLAADSGHSLIELGNQHLETWMEIRNGGSRSVADNEAEEQQETHKSCSLSLSFSVPIIIDTIMANTNKSGRTSAELILCKASAAFALLSFLAGVALFISLQNNSVGMITQLGLKIVAIVSLLTGIMILAVNVVF